MMGMAVRSSFPVSPRKPLALYGSTAARRALIALHAWRMNLPDRAPANAPPTLPGRLTFASCAQALDAFPWLAIPSA